MTVSSRCRLTKFFVAAGAFFALTSPAGATILFSDTLQTALTQWNNPNPSGAIVAAPGGDNAIYLRNMTLTDNPNDTAMGTATVSSASTAAPEATSVAAFITALVGLGAARVGFKRKVVRSVSTG